MKLSRRRFLGITSGVLGASVLVSPPESALASPSEGVRDEWETIRELFNFDRSYIHMGGMLFASHPKPVRDAIERHRKAFDLNPVHYVHNNSDTPVRSAAGRYLDTMSSNIALTDSTTMGIGLLYTGLKVSSGQEILTTTHDHIVTEKALSYASERTGATVQRVSLYSNSAEATENEIVSRLKAGITSKTRIVAVTWVHSSTGVRLPISRISEEIRLLNRNRDERDQILFCVDGVHGFGVENVTMEGLGCDFFVAGTHKWMHGPRGTGIICARNSSTWSNVRTTIPSFTGDVDGYRMTPGGYHSFEHRWALKEAFEFHLEIGKAKIQNRIHALNTQMKEGLRKIPGVTIHTPLSENLSAGIICFSVRGYSPSGVVDRLEGSRIIATQSPYSVSYARVTPSLLNSPEEVDKTLAAIAKL